MTIQKQFFNLLLLCSVGVFALRAHDHEIRDVFTSSPAYTFDTAFRALIVTPITSNLHYAAQANPLPVPSPNWVIHDIHPKYHFGFDLTFNGIFHNLGSNLYANWQHVRASDSACVDLAAENMVGPFFEIGPDATPYNNATGRVSVHFNEVNVNYGQYVDFGCNLHTNIFAGVSFAHIEQCLASTYSNPTGTITRTITTPNVFHGAGPQVGVDFVYDMGCGFQFAGRASAAILSGRVKNATTYASNSPFLAGLGVTAPNTQTTTMCNRITIVPSFNQRIGLAYAAEFCDHYLVKLEVGYQAQVYIGALQSVDMGSEVVTPPVIPDAVGVYARTFQRNQSNFALTGPYVSINFGF